MTLDIGIYTDIEKHDEKFLVSCDEKENSTKSKTFIWSECHLFNVLISINVFSYSFSIISEILINVCFIAFL